MRKGGLGKCSRCGDVAISAESKGELVDVVAKKMIEEKKIRFDRAKELVAELSKSKRAA